jgi:FkbM family methyltransferase
MKFREAINRILQRTSYRINKFHPAINRHYDKRIKLSLEHILAYQMIHADDFFFVQIGANNGVRGDKLYPFVTRHNLKGIVIEPLKDLFEQLVVNYSDYPKIKPLNAAIDKEDGMRTLYRIDPNFKDMPEWGHAIASFNHNHVQEARKNCPGIEKHIITEEVPCISFKSLIISQQIEKIDLLQIDTEGYDFEIIKTIDFELMPPQIIRYEHGAFSIREAKECVEFLIERGYILYDERQDTIAYRTI